MTAQPSALEAPVSTRLRRIGAQKDPSALARTSRSIRKNKTVSASRLLNPTIRPSVTGSPDKEYRVTTFYGVMQVRGTFAKPIGVEIKAPQGPHTIPHCGIVDALKAAKSAGKLGEFVDRLPSPGRFAEIVKMEVTHPRMQNRAAAAIKRYRQIHSTISNLYSRYNRGDHAVADDLMDNLNKAHNIHPYATYAYKTPRARLGQRTKKNKSETVSKPMSDQLDFKIGLFADHKKAEEWVRGTAAFIDQVRAPATDET